MMTQEIAVSINRAENRFELEMEGKLSFIAYFPKDDHTLVLTRTEVHPNLIGDGIGSLLVRGMLEYIERHRLKIIPLCAYVAAYLRRYPEFTYLIYPGNRVVK